MKMLAQLTFISVFMFSAHLAVAVAPADYHASSVDTGERPIGVEAKDWIPVSDKLGFVIVTTVEPPADKNIYAQPRDARPLFAPVAPPPASAAGYFMIKTADGWRRLVVMSPADISVAKR